LLSATVIGGNMSFSPALGRKQLSRGREHLVDLAQSA
jgi:hypothetical protein